MNVLRASLFLLLLASGSVRSAESDPAPAAPPPAQADKPADTTAGPAKPQPGKSGDEREEFKPSEEISEDFAVSFPVDI